MNKTMKRTLLALCLGLGLSMPALARGWNVRIEAGGHASNLSETSGSYSSAYGYHVGGALELELTSGLYLAPGVTWLRTSSKSTATLLGADIFPEIKAENIQIPLSLGVRFKPLDVLGVSLEAGPYLSYTLRGDESIAGTAKSIISALEVNDRIAWGVGASAAFEVSVLYLRFGIQKGMSNPSLGEAYAVARDILQMGNARDANLYLSLGLRF